MTSTQPPGWYPDASMPGHERWWDGVAWSPVTRPAEAVTAAQDPGPPAPSADQGAAGGQPADRQPYGQPSGSYEQPDGGYGQPGSPYGQPAFGQPGAGQPGAGQPGAGQPGGGFAPPGGGYGQPTGGYEQSGEPASATPRSAAPQSSHPSYPAPPAGQAGPQGPMQQGSMPYGSMPYGAAPYAGAAPSGLEANLASRGLRLVARIIDGILVGIVASIVGFPFLGRAMSGLQDIIDSAEAGVSSPDTGSFTRPLIAFSLVAAVISAAYHVSLIATRGATLGKSAVGVKVQRLVDQGRPTWGESAMRWATTDLPGLIPTVGGLYSLLDALWCLWDPKRQCIHDKLPKTVVVRSR